MSFEGKYRLLEPIPDLSASPELEILARDLATGQPVVIHFLAGRASAENRSLVLRARSLPPESAANVLETGEFQKALYVVTKVLPENLSFRAWMAKASAQSPVDTRLDELQSPGKFRPPGISTTPAQALVPPAPPSGGPEPGEFTRMFMASQGPAAAPPPSASDRPVDLEATQTIQMPIGRIQELQASLKAPQAPATPPLPPPTIEPGEFTRLFQAGQGLGAPPPKAPVSPPPAMPPLTVEPGEFTRLFQTGQNPQTASTAPTPPQAVRFDAKPAPPPTPPKMTPAAGIAIPPPSARSAPPALPAREPGEFTQLFQAKQPLAAPPPQAPPPPIPPAHQPGEFTQLFQSKQPPAVPPQAAPPQAVRFDPAPTPPANQPGEFTQLFQAKQPPAAPPQAAPPQAVRFDPAPTPPPNQPGEFTQLFQAKQPPAGPPQAPPPQAVRFDPKPPQPPAPGASGEMNWLFTNPETPPARTPGGLPPEAEKTRLFQPATPPQGQPPAQSAGEFTRMMQGPGAAPSTPSAPPRTFTLPNQQPPAVDPLNAAAPGEFTKMFERPLSNPRYVPPNAAPPPPGDFSKMLDGGFGQPTLPNPYDRGKQPTPTVPQAPQGAAPMGDFTRMFNSAGGAVSPAGPLAPQGPIAPAAPPAAGPGEYTRMFGPSATPAPAAPAPAPAPRADLKPAIKPAAPNMTVIIVIAAVVLLAIVGAGVFFIVAK